MHWRRLVAASLELAAELLDLLAEEIYKPPVRSRVRKPTAKALDRPGWYDGLEREHHV